jgi:hypothetical protein
MSKAGGGRPIVEHALTLDIRHLRRDGLLSGGSGSGAWRWHWGSLKQLTGLVEYEGATQEDSGDLHLKSITRFDPMGKPVTTPGQTIRLVTTIPPYGGRRWWFLCPRTGKRVMKLHLPYGAHAFASRQAYRLGYAVQREAPRDKAYRRARKARHRIGGSDNLALPLPNKPKWMRWPTYDRLVAECQVAERHTLGFLAAAAERLLGRPAI